MDVITHLGSGALLSRSSIGKYGRAAAFAVIGGAIFPDIDIFLLFFGYNVAYKHHRGLTHSFVGLLIFPFIMALPIYLIGKYKKYWHLVGFFSLGMLIHIFLDWAGSWGTQVLYPFTDKRYSLDFISFIETYFALIMFVFLFISVRLKNKGRKIARIGVVVAGFYICLCIICHFIALAKFNNTLQEINVKPIKVSAIPRFRAGPFGWRGIAESESSFYRSQNIYLFSKAIEIKGIEKEPLNKFVELASQLKEVELFVWYAEYLFIKTVDTQNLHIVKMWDLRYRDPEQDSSFLPSIQIIFDDKGKVLNIEE